MWQPFSKLLEGLGRLGVHFGSQDTMFSIGEDDGVDSEGGLDWREYRTSRALWEAWGPLRGSPWEPFHCVTLFAALDELRRDAPNKPLGPVAEEGLPDYAKPSTIAPPWGGADTLIIVDLPGAQAVAVGLALAAGSGYQPVCTFDNWPHERGVLRTERVLAALLYYASAMAKTREHLAPGAPPVWLCDRERFTGTKPSPRRFDNRYIIEDRLLPGSLLLRKSGIRKVIYLCPDGASLPSEDLRHYLDELQAKGFDVSVVATETEATWTTPRPYVRKFASKTGWSPTSLGLMRSSAGGFGDFVPPPSSGG
jgi:hypothetical protein